MAGMKSRKYNRGGGVPERDEQRTGAPMRVSGGSKLKDITGHDFRNLDENNLEVRVVLKDRPSTSGGTSTRKSMDKRQTRDDLHLFSSSSGIQVGTSFYDFPLPASLPTPAASPHSSPSRLSSRVSTEPEDLEPDPTPREVEIGMALGSPTHAPATWNPQVRFLDTSRDHSPESMEDWIANHPPLKAKSSKWKLFGLFGKKTSGSPTPSQKMQSEMQDFDRPDYATFPSPPMEKTRGKSTTEKRKTKHQKPELNRANTMPESQTQRSTDPPKEFPMPSEAPRNEAPGVRMLEVIIPDVEMERYSIMFANAIRSDASTSALLARRQTTLDRLQTVNDAIAKHVGTSMNLAYYFLPVLLRIIPNSIPL
jgi:hypothetical protein